ncbi:MAG TPA: hypothetical protein VGS19_09685 [Streptosporangiaceae bacterium]|nr:hypothetical protein [Streptosporangiaceae bacterium]
MLRTAVAAVGAVTALTCSLAACAPLRMGAAAIVGDHRISSATLTNEVANVQATLAASKGKIPPQVPASELPQQVLSWLLRFQVREELASQARVTVTTAERQQALAGIAAQARQGGAASVSLADLAAANGLPPNLLNELGRYQAIENAVINRLDNGTLPTSQLALQALSLRFNHMQCLTAKRLAIRVNPQYGRLDYGQLAIVAAPPTLSALPVPARSQSPAPQLRPAC